MEEKLYKIPLTSILSVVGERKQKQSLLPRREHSESDRLG